MQGDTNGNLRKPGQPMDVVETNPISLFVRLDTGCCVLHCCKGFRGDALLLPQPLQHLRQLAKILLHELFENSLTSSSSSNSEFLSSALPTRSACADLQIRPLPQQQGTPKTTTITVHGLHAVLFPNVGRRVLRWRGLLRLRVLSRRIGNFRGLLVLSRGIGNFRGCGKEGLQGEVPQGAGLVVQGQYAEGFPFS